MARNAKSKDVCRDFDESKGGIDFDGSEFCRIWKHG